MNTDQLETRTQCGTAEKPLIENPVKRLIRRVIETAKPTHARVRYDTRAQMWAVLGATDQPVRHFPYGYMENARFSVHHSVVSTGCGGSTNYAVAEGELYTESHSGPLTGWRNLRFDGQKMTGVEGATITEARAIRFMPGRSALYLPDTGD